MTPLPIDHIAFGLLAVVFPIWDYFATRKRAALINAGRTELRMATYRRIIGEEWLIATVLVVGWFALGRSAGAIGFDLQGGARAWSGYVTSALICAVLFVQTRSVLRKPESLISMQERFRKVMFLLPQTNRERRTFDAVSITAGICEEVIYRGYLIAYLAAALGAPFWVAAAGSAIIFGYAHSYQGPSGVPRVAAVGGLLALLYGSTGSLWAPMVVHAAMDLAAGRVAYAATNRNGHDRSAPELAA